MNVRLQNRQTNPNAIAKLEIESLHGFLNFPLESNTGGQSFSLPLVILYGQNGCGKTTVLRILFHILNPNSEKKRDKFLWNLLFKKIRIELSNQVWIQVEREKTQVGEFALSIAGPSAKLVSRHVDSTTLFESEPEGYRREQSEFSKQLSHSASSLIFLTDTRTLDFNFFPSGNVTTSRDLTMFERHMRRPLRRRGEERGWNQTRNPAVLEGAIDSLTGWFRTRSNIANREGESSSFQVYRSILKRLATPMAKGRASTVKTISEQHKRLEGIGTRLELLSGFGLVTSIDHKSLITATTDPPESRRRVVSNVLDAYLSGIEARLKNLEGIYSQIASLIHHLENFLRTCTRSIVSLGSVGGA